MHDNITKACCRSCQKVTEYTLWRSLLFCLLLLSVFVSTTIPYHKPVCYDLCCVALHFVAKNNLSFDWFLHNLPQVVTEM